MKRGDARLRDDVPEEFRPRDSKYVNLAELIEMEQLLDKRGGEIVEVE